jgi:hypothetical protein
MDNEISMSYYRSQMKAIKEDKTVRESYAKPTCRHCYGKGVLDFGNRLVICQCVIKGLKKEIEQLG